MLCQILGFYEYGGYHIYTDNYFATVIPPPLVTSCRFLPEIQARPSVVDHLCSSPVASLSWVMYTRVLEVDLDMSP